MREDIEMKTTTGRWVDKFCESPSKLNQKQHRVTQTLQLVLAATSTLGSTFTFWEVVRRLPSLYNSALPRTKTT